MTQARLFGLNAGARAVLRTGIVLLLAAAGGCATLEPVSGYRDAAEPRVRECENWYASLDAAVDGAAVRDFQSTRIEGFRYLRVDRFYASLRVPASIDERALDILVDRLLALDMTARGHEISNLPAERLAELWRDLGEPGVAATVQRTRECARLLRAFDMVVPGVRAALLARLKVPDDYVDAYRVVGLYVMSRVPFSAGVRRHLEQTRAAFGRDLNATAQGTVVRYSPPGRPKVTREQIRQILARSAYNPLRLPEPGYEDMETLFAHYAPSFEVETTGDFDRPGALRWRWGPVPEVDSADLAVYRQAAYTRYRGVNLLQLVYTIWFPERPPDSSADLLAGKLDGVVLRVTLAPDGTSILYDTMHPCGCYHMFVTTPRAARSPAPEGEPEWAFVPQTLAGSESSDRLVVRIASRSHYVERIYADPLDSLARYEFRPYDELRSLPRMGRGARSVFGPDGFIAGTERAERYLFWPMGIANAGAMRQWGHHPTAFVGRRHFDDADLIERRFTLDLQ